MRKKEHLTIEGLEKLRIIKDSINSPELHTPSSNISVNSEGDTVRVFRGRALSLIPPTKVGIRGGRRTASSYSSIAMGGDVSNKICTTNLIAILSDISIYNEVYALIRSNSLLHKSLSGGEDKQALDEMSEAILSKTSLIESKGGSLRSRKLKEVREGIKN